MDKRQGFIEAFEADEAVIIQADRSVIHVSRACLPAEARKGQFVIELDESGDFVIDHDTTEKRMQVLRSMCECFYD